MLFRPTFWASALIALSLNVEVVQSADISALITQCDGCHAGTVVASDPSVPNIRGQHFFYVYTQLKDYKADRRSHAVMTPMSQQLNKKQMKSLAQHYSELPWVAFKSEISGANEKRALEILGSGGRNACLKCHANLIGLNGTPRLAGQKATYLRSTMLAFKNKTRLNAGAKNTLFKDVTDSDIDALSSFISSQ